MQRAEARRANESDLPSSQFVRPSAMAQFTPTMETNNTTVSKGSKYCKGEWVSFVGASPSLTTYEVERLADAPRKEDEDRDDEERD